MSAPLQSLTGADQVHVCRAYITRLAFKRRVHEARMVRGPGRASPRRDSDMALFFESLRTIQEW